MIDRTANTMATSVDMNRATRNDPATHQSAERQFVDHFHRLLDEGRLLIDMGHGLRPVKGLRMSDRRSDHAVQLRRLMSELDMPDRELESRMPIAPVTEVRFNKRRLLPWRRKGAQIRLICTSPTRALLGGQDVTPLSAADVQRALAVLPTPPKEPTITVLVATAGLEPAARALVQDSDAAKLAGGRNMRTLILVEPADPAGAGGEESGGSVSGGWKIHGPPRARALCELLDPESAAQKSRRVAAQIAARQFELSGSGIAADALAAEAGLPLSAVETELRTYARQHSGLAAKRLGGRMVLYREAASLAGSGASVASAAGGQAMALFDRIKSLFARKGETEKKIAFLSERRTSLSQQRDRAYEEISQLEAKDQELRNQFKTGSATLAKRRIAGQLLQLRKDVARRQQMIGVLNQQVNVVSTHLHNLELVQQGKLAELPNSEQIAEDAAAAEEMLAELSAQSELSETAGGLDPMATGATAGLSAEEAALFAELEAEGGATAPKPNIAEQKVEPDEAPMPEKRDAASSAKRASAKQKPGAELG
jgi:hypothetical protein